MPIKDKDYWKVYNQKRKEKGYFQQNYQTRKEQVVKSEVVKPPQVVKNNSVVKSEPIVKSLQPEPVVKNESLQPLQEKVKELKEQLEAISKLPAEYIDNREAEIRANHQKETKLLETQIDKLQTQIKELEQPINPTIEKWKTDYFSLEKKTNEQLQEQQATINRLKEKLRAKETERQQLIEKYSKTENISKNQTNSLTMPNLFSLIKKHKHWQTIQRIYQPQEIKEREFLNSLLNQLWDFN